MSPRLRPNVRALLCRIAAHPVPVGDVHRSTLRAARERGLLEAVDPSSGRVRGSAWAETDRLSLTPAGRQAAA